MLTDIDHRVQAAKVALTTALSDATPRKWEESISHNVAVVLAFDVSVKADGTHLEELAGWAIHEGTQLHLAVYRSWDCPGFS